MNDGIVEVWDMYCAAWLHVCGLRIERIPVDVTGKASFLFVDNGLASRCMGEWRTQRAWCDARAYADSLKTTKRLLITAVNDWHQPKTTGELKNDSAQPTPTPR